MIHIQAHMLTNRGYFFLICTLFPPKCHLCCGCRKSGLSSVSGMREHYLPIPSSIRLNQPSGGHSFTLWNITFSPSLRYHGSRYKKIFFSLPLFDFPPPARAEEEPLLIFISHMFRVQRKKLTYHEVLTVTQKGLHQDTLVVQNDAACGHL